MKRSHLFGIVIIAIAIAVLMSTAGDASSYVTFKEAYEMAEDGDNKQIHVVGKLKKDATGQIVGMEYNPQLDPNHFAFIMVDENNQEQQVIYSDPKPQDFDRSEQVVVIGSVQNKQFIAEKILMKCPSKYQENEIKVKDTKTANF